MQHLVVTKLLIFSSTKIFSDAEDYAEKASESDSQRNSHEGER